MGSRHPSPNVKNLCNFETRIWLEIITSRDALVARAIRNAIRADRFARIIRNRNPYFYSASGRFARITRVSDSRESPDSRESCESIRANHATMHGDAKSACFKGSQTSCTETISAGFVMDASR